MTADSMGPRLDRLARIAVRDGVGLQPGQPLHIVAPLAAHGFVHRLAKAAYKAGGGPVSCTYQDRDLIRLALTEMDPGVIAVGKGLTADGSCRSLQVAVLHLAGPEPALLDGIPVERIVALHNLLRLDENHASDTNACIMPFATHGWATAIRPGRPADQAIAALWNDIFVLCGADRDEAAEGLAARLDRAAQVCDALNSMRLARLRLLGNGTDLHLLPLPGAPWSFSRRTTSAGVHHLAELPPGSIRSLLEPSATNGVLNIVHPLRIAGATVRNLVLEFEEGRVVQCSAASGQEAFEQLIATDHGAARLGMIGLVEPPDEMSGPAEGFLAPILDRAFRAHVTFGSGLDAFDQPVIAGANHSALSIDAFLDVSASEIHGHLSDGGRVALQLNGKFSFP